MGRGVYTLSPTLYYVYRYNYVYIPRDCQFANSIFKQVERQTIATPIHTSDYPTAAIRPSNSKLDCTTTQAIFGITRPFWRDGLEKIIRELESKHDKA